MTRLARWIYRDMLDVYYDTEKPLSKDLDRLCDEIGVSEDAERAVVQRLLRFKFTETDVGYVHEVCEAKITEYHYKAEIAKANGKLGGRPVKAKANPKEPSGFQLGYDPDSLGNPEATGSEANHKPLTTNHKPRTKRRGAKAPLSADKLPTWMQSIVNLYHEILPELPGVRVMDKARDQALRDFWDWVMTSKRPDGTHRATNEDEALAWVRDFMTRARNNDFIMGRGQKSPDHQNWVCSIEFLLSSKGIKKVVEETKDHP